MFAEIFLSFQRMYCWWINTVRRAFGLPPSLRCWLLANENVEAAISWQTDYAGSAYAVTDAVRHRYRNWTRRERDELQQHFNESWRWLKTDASVTDATAEGILYPPINRIDSTNDATHPWTNVEDAWARQFYLRWTAHSLAVELSKQTPWSITAYTLEELRILLDSNSMLVKLPNPGYALANGFSEHSNYRTRDQNRGSSMPAPPKYTHSFLVDHGMVVPDRLTTIHNLLDWISANCIHFEGAFNYEETDNHWQYRGLPPISRIIEGTTNANTPTVIGSAHWTAGCHGTTGLIRNILRAANIPVTITRVCGHSQAIFTTDGPLYLDHGDNLYNLTFKATGLPVSDVLIDHATYVAWFGSGTDNRDVADCGTQIGRQVDELTGPR